jgi:hypothetical protein
VVTSDKGLHLSFDSVFFSHGHGNPFAGGIAIKSSVIMEHVVAGKFRLGRKIGSGSFGELYLGMLHMPYAQNGCHFVNQMSVFNVIFLDSGISIQNGEEVGIKLVCADKLACIPEFQDL